MKWSFRTSGNYVEFVHTDETDLHIESVVHRLHNTSRCIDWSLPEDTTRISFTIDETRYENVSIYDIDFDGDVMGVQGDFETGITEVFSGLSSSFFVEEVELTNTQIKELPTTAIEVVPAPGSGKVIIIHNAYAYVKGSDYTNVDAAGVAGLVWYPDIYFAMAMWRGIGYANLFGFGESIISPTLQESKVAVASAPSVPFVQQDFEGVVSGIDNRAVYFYCTNGSSGNFTGGSAANTMRIKVWYTIEYL